MQRKGIIKILLIIPIVLCQLAKSQQLNENDLAKKANQYIDLVEQGKFRDASLLFNYPRDYTKEELLKDRSTVQKWLEMIVDAFGSIKSKHILQSSSVVYEVRAGGGNLPYWQKHPKGFHIRYYVEFSKQGEGKIDIQFCHINSKWEIRDVGYGLPTFRLDAQSFIAKLLDKMSRLLKQTTTQEL